MERIKLNIQRFGVGVSISGSDGEINVANNTSYINGIITISVDGSTYNTGGTAYYQINGGSPQYFSINRNSSVSFGYRLGAYTHNADGSLPPQTVSVYVRITSSTSTSGSISVPMQTIPRYAVTNSASGSDINGTFKVNYTKYVSSWQYKLRISIPNVTLLERINYNTSGQAISLSPESRNAICNYFTNTNNVSLGFAVETWSGSSKLSDGNEVRLTGKITDANPLFSDFEFEDINPTTVALTGNNKINVKGYSNTQVTISTANKAEAQKSATMSEYKYSNGENSIKITYSNTDSVSGIILGTTSGTHNVYATDSRGNTTQVIKMSTSEVSYDPIYLDAINCSATRTDNGVGTGCILKFSGNYWNNNFGSVLNTLHTIAYKLKKTSSTTWINGRTTITPTINNDGSFSFEGAIGSNNNDYSWDLEDSYDIKLILEDELSTKEVNLILASAKPTLSLDREGVGILCAYDSSIGGALQIKGQPIGEEIYSTTEQVIGKWIDNKPLYRKVIQVSNPSSYDIDISSLNAEWLEIENMQLEYTLNNVKYSFQNSGYAGSNDYTRVYRRNNVIRLTLGSVQSGGTGQRLTYIIKYTKTTD